MKKRVIPKLPVGNLSLEALLRALDRQCRHLPSLIGRPSLLKNQIDVVVGLVRRARRRAIVSRRKQRQRASRRKETLADMLADVMRGRYKVTTTEAMEGLLAAGYEGKARFLRDAVNHILRTNPRFVKVGRGEFVLKENSAPGEHENED